MEDNIQPPVIPKQKVSRLPTLTVIILIFVLLLTTGYFYLQTQSLRRQLAYINSLPTPSPAYVYTKSPSPAPTSVANIVKTSRQTVNLLTPKYLDNPQEKESYKISFAKVGVNPKYYISDDIFPKLIIEGDKYQFTLEIPKEGQEIVFSEIPPYFEVNTSQFNKVIRINNPFIYMKNDNTPYDKDKTYYSYTTDFSTNCTQMSPRPPACSMLQIYYTDQSAPLGKVYISASCISSDSSPTDCDKIISTLEINR